MPTNHTERPAGVAPESFARQGGVASESFARQGGVAPESFARAALVWLVIALVAVACGSGATTAPAETATEATTSTGVIGEAEVVAAADAFVAEFSSTTAMAFVEAATAAESDRWVPWLLDVLRLDPSLQTSNAISAALADVTGVPSESRVADMIAYGSWSASRGLDGGAGYRDFKTAIYARIDERFGPLLASVEDQAELAAIQWGGVPVGGIPELNDPVRVEAVEATWMFDDEVVLGVEVNGEAVAYPLRILARHELANDVVGGDALAIVYCTLCRSALVYEREVDGEVVRFLTSGLLSNSNKIMLDVETETLWSHLRGVGIGGTHLGTELVLRPVTHMRWSDWLAERPDTEVLALPEPIFFDDPERPPIAYDYSPGAAYASYYENPDVWFPIIDTPDTWPLKTEVLGLEHNGDSIALAIEELNAAGRNVTIEVGGASFLIEPTGVGARVFDEAGNRIIAEQSFWFAWYANHPDTRTLVDL